ncbi:MAG: cytochrome c [Thiogranum sp.]|nr:cytochrome c [Thiogranum sp.]
MRGERGAGFGIAVGVAGILLIGLAIWLLVVYTGAYNVAATDPHADVVRWTFNTTKHHSIKGRASDITPPEQVSEKMVSEGARIYAETCAHCHGEPGAEHEPWASNMRPEPPELTEAAAEWEVHEVFWIVKHGLKMTGMPAFDPEHDDETIWGIAAFVKRLPGMTPEAYQGATRGASHRH